MNMLDYAEHCAKLHAYIFYVIFHIFCVLCFFALLLGKMKIILSVPKFVYVKTRVIHRSYIWLEVQIISLVSIESAKLRAYAPYPSLIRALRACASLLTNKRLTHLFLSCGVVSILRYALRLKNPRKATGPDFIPLKFIKIPSNVIDSHLYNINKRPRKKQVLRGAKNSISKTHFQEKWKKQRR